MFLARRGRTTRRYIDGRGDHQFSHARRRLGLKDARSSQRMGLLNLRREGPVPERKCTQGFIVLIVAHAKRWLFKPITTSTATGIDISSARVQEREVACMQRGNHLRDED